MSTSAAPATCEDYDSDNSDAVPDTRTQANVAVKRTPSGRSIDGAPAIPVAAATGAPPKKLPVSVVGPDGASDSGYSSHTAATVASADSAQSSKTGISSNSGSAGDSTPSAAVRPDVTSKPSPRRRPSQPRVAIPGRNDPRPAAAVQSSPKKLQSRYQSRPRRDTVAEDYPDQSHVRGRRPQPAPLQTPRERGYSYSTRTPQSSTFIPSPSPDAARRPHRQSGAYAHAPAIVQQDPPARRRSSSTAPRPVSFHSGMPTGMTPEQYYLQMQQYGYNSAVPDPRAPPPSTSAWPYATMSMYPSPQRYPVVAAMPPNRGYMPAGALPSPNMASHELARIPADQMDGSYSTRAPRRPSLAYGAGAIILQQDPDSFAPSPTALSRQYSARYSTNTIRRFRDEGYTEESSEEDMDDPSQVSDGEMRRRQDRRDMPPPLMIPNRGHRPSQSYSARGPSPVIVNPTYPQTTPARRPSQSHPRANALTQQEWSVQSPSRSSSRRPSTSTRPRSGQYYSYHGRSGDPTAVHMHVERSVPVPSTGQRLRRRESYLADDPSVAVKQKRAERSAEAYIAQTGSGNSSRRQSTYRRAVEAPRRPARRPELRNGSESETDSESTSEEDPFTPRRRAQGQRRPSRPETARTRTAPSQPLTEKALKRRSGASGTGPKESNASTSRTGSGREVERHTSAPASTISGVERTKEGYKIRVEGGTLDFGDLRGRTLQIRPVEDGSGGAEFLIGGAVREDDADRRTDRSDRDRRYAGTSSKTSRTSGSAVTKGRRREVDLMKEDKASRKSSRRRRDVE